MVFIEAARYLGFGARFVSGYLYDPALDRGDATQAVAATHAWAEVYLPGRRPSSRNWMKWAMR
jgi:transglutaminase-like putative cysteine protease